MYKVLLPLPGYGYCIGDETKHITDEDAKTFLAQKKIELISGESKGKEADPELEALQARFQELSGKPAGNMKKETLLKKVAELEAK